MLLAGCRTAPVNHDAAPRPSSSVLLADPVAAPSPPVASVRLADPLAVPSPSGAADRVALEPSASTPEKREGFAIFTTTRQGSVILDWHPAGYMYSTLRMPIALGPHTAVLVAGNQTRRKTFVVNAPPRRIPMVIVDFDTP